MYQFTFCLVIVLFFASCSTKPDETSATIPDRQEVTTPPEDGPEGMVWIPGGTYLAGNDGSEASVHEGPAHTVQIDGFWMDETEVTNAQFREFVEETGYVTIAERPIDWEEIKKNVPPGTPKPADSILQPGSMVFSPPDYPVSLNDYSQWWAWVIGANWRHPYGPESSIEGKDNFPVVHIAYEDAVAYADWAGKRLPTEAEFEFAARNAKSGAAFAWGDELTPQGKYLANFFQGDFPHRVTSDDGYTGIAPVKSYPPNSYGLYEIIGNVWEWTSDWYRPDTYSQLDKMTVCKNPTGPESSYDPTDPYNQKRVIKGGSYLCSTQYCSNYRPSARMATAIDSGQEHLGFRCVKSLPNSTP